MSIAVFSARGLALLAGMIAILFSFTGCKVIVEEPEQSPPAVEAQRTIMTQGVSALPEFDSAVAAIDFDPPIRSDTLLRSQGPVKLLAAVENNGTMALYDLKVEASLSSQGIGVPIRDSVIVEKLAPGETRVVEFLQMASVSTLPRSSSYQVGVTVSGRQPDANPQDNSHQVTLRVSDD